MMSSGGTAFVSSADAVVIGAGLVGAAVAHELVLAGLSVVIVDRGTVASGSTGAGEGNILVSDKEPGPELDLAVLSRALWAELLDDLGHVAELEPKGGVVVASDESSWSSLRDFAGRQRSAGVTAQEANPGDLRVLEPNLRPDLIGGVFYPEDMQVQPMLAAAHLLRLATERGALTRLDRCLVVGIDTAPDGSINGVRTAQGRISTPIVINCAGTWGGEVAALAGVDVPIMPRRGFILVTEPLPPVVHHKVYSADYVANVASGAAGLETSTVVEGTRAGTVLIGASRERIGFDRRQDWAVVSRLARQAIDLFPFLSDVSLLRTYLGFRPYCPDHLPVIGPDPRRSGLYHACGHEGAGIGLSIATGRLIAQSVKGIETSLNLSAFSPMRFEAANV